MGAVRCRLGRVIINDARESERFRSRRVGWAMDDKPPRETPIGFDDPPDKASLGAFKISGIAIALAAVICLGLIALVVARSGGI